jgi:hypothetical protein
MELRTEDEAEEFGQNMHKDDEAASFARQDMANWRSMFSKESAWLAGGFGLISGVVVLLLWPFGIRPSFKELYWALGIFAALNLDRFLDELMGCRGWFVELCYRTRKIDGHTEQIIERLAAIEGKLDRQSLEQVQRKIPEVEGAAHMNEEGQKRLIRYLAKRVKELYRELLVHRGFVQLLKEIGYQDVDSILESARQSPAVQERYEAYFRGFDELIPPVDEDFEEQALRELLQRWKPDGEPN